MSKYAEGIRKTGFILENKVANILRNNKWTIISNKYYEDDFEGSVREIDLLAYKVSKVQGVRVYTALLISCKKSEADIWALLARRLNENDPNSDWSPLHTWSNDKALIYEMEKPGQAKVYHDEIKALGVEEALSIPQYEVFAFQEMNRESGAPKNDKNIFGAVTSLMKAQAYELGVLPKRKTSPSIYQFNLLSIIDSELYRLVVNEESITEEEIESEHYISRYIIRKNENFSRIRFITARALKEKLKDYGRLHEANTKWFGNRLNDFYNDILKDYKKTAILLEEFKERVKWDIYFHTFDEFREPVDLDETKMSIRWNKKDNLAAIMFEDQEVVEFFNKQESIIKTFSEALKDVYRYTGKFRFSLDDVPF